MSKSTKKVLENKVQNNDEDAQVPQQNKRQRAEKHVEPEPFPHFQPPARANLEDKEVVPVFTKNKKQPEVTRTEPYSVPHVVPRTRARSRAKQEEK